MNEPKRYHSDEKIKMFAVDYRRGALFGSWQITDPKDWSMVFLPLAMMDKAQVEQLRADSVAHVAEYIDKAGPRSINGYPVFFSMIAFTEADAAALRALVEKLEAAEKAALG